MYQILFANALNQQIVRHTMVNTKEEADQYLQKFIKSKDIDEDIILFDYEKQTYKARFSSHEIYKNEDVIVYKILFNMKLSEVQSVIK